jgi:sugar phosphate isomerase/epimerase
MQIATAGWGFRELSLPDYFKMATDLGIQFVEVNAQGYEEVPLHLDVSMDEGKLSKVREAANQAGVEIVCLAGTNDFTVDGKELDKHIQKVKKTIDLAQKIGASIIRIFAGWVEAKDVTEKLIGQVAKCLEDVGSYAQTKRITIAMENHGGIAATASDCKKILDKVKSSAVGLNYDPANFIAYGYGENPLMALESLSERIVYAHLKDCLKKGDRYEFAAVGQGEMNWDRILPALSKVYDGYWAIEYEEPVNIRAGTEKSLQFLREKIKGE